MNLGKGESQVTARSVGCDKYKMISPHLGLIHLGGRIAGRWERGRGREDGSVGGGVRKIVRGGSNGGEDLETGRR